MKKILFISLMCLMALTLNAQEYIDLGLPSGTKWKAENESGFFYNYNSAFLDFGNSLPTKEQFKELKDNCKWEWENGGYRITGPNGNSIYLPAEGFRACDGNLLENGKNGSYWSYNSSELEHAWCLHFSSSRIAVSDPEKCTGRAVRLVQSK